MEMVRVVREMREHEKRNGRTGVDIRPRFMVWENVPGAFSSNKGEDFRAVLEETAKIADETIVIPGPPKGKWNTAGCIMGDSWSIAWRVLDAQYWGVPQRRRRIYLVADFGGQSAPEVLFKSEGLSRHLTESRETGEGIAADAERSVGETIDIMPFNTTQITSPQNGNRVEYGLPCHTLNATDHPPAIVERSTPKTMLVRCGCRGGGKGPLIQDNKSATLSCANIQTLFEPIAIDSNCQDSRFKLTGDIVPRVTDYTVVAVHQNASGEVRQNKVANTLNTNSNASGRNAPLIAGTVSSKWAKGTGGPAGDECQNLVCRPLRAQSQHSHREDSDNVVLQRYSVRRLTPLECERLQDFPDGWTDIPGASDSARYKALGNSIAVCCAEYVLEGIKEAINQ